VSVGAASVPDMPTPRIDAVSLVVSDLERTVAFYRALGCDLPDPPGAGGHLDADLGNFRLLIDTEEIARSFDPAWEGSGSGRVTLAARCDSPSEVDRLHDELSALGSGSQLAPFDAFWGQRYATVLDPDGIRVDLYAELAPHGG
jgi:catechol 2,3-dioxygenase-like lactoylglutathione lyase family enzyme